MRRTLPMILLLIVAIAVLAIVNLLIGSVDIPVKAVCKILLSPLLSEGQGEASEIWTNIVWKSRLPQALTAIVAGAGLAVSGLQMQTVFRNPLAGPSVLGISNGSALGVAFVVLLSGRIGGVALSRLGYLGDAAMSVAAIVGALAVMLVIVSSGVLVAIVTAYCGPIMFIGLAVPHLARVLFRTSDHRVLMPGTALCGAALALVCNLLARMPGFEGALPVNSVTALVGAPVIAAVIFGRRKDDVKE